MRLLSLLLILGFTTATINAQSAHPILKAIKKGDLVQVQNEIDIGIELNKTFEPGYTPLCVAVKYKQEAIIQLLLKSDIDLNKMSNNKTPLMYAAKYGHLDIAKLLLKSGAKKDLLSPKGKTALDYAKKYEQEAIISFLKSI